MLVLHHLILVLLVAPFLLFLAFGPGDAAVAAAAGTGLHIREVVASPPNCAPASSQVPVATTYWAQFYTTMTLPHTTTATTTWKEIEYTQTFGQPTTAPLPATGTIGMGTLTGEIGVVKPTVTTIAGIVQEIDKGYAVQTSGGFRRRPRPFLTSLSLVPWTPPKTPYWKIVMRSLFGVVFLQFTLTKLIEHEMAHARAVNAEIAARERRRAGIPENDDDEIDPFEKEMMDRMEEKDGEKDEMEMMERMRDRVGEMKYERRHE